MDLIQSCCYHHGYMTKGNIYTEWVLLDAQQVPSNTPGVESFPLFAHSKKVFSIALQKSYFTAWREESHIHTFLYCIYITGRYPHSGCIPTFSVPVSVIPLLPPRSAPITISHIMPSPTHNETCASSNQVHTQPLRLRRSLKMYRKEQMVSQMRQQVIVVMRHNLPRSMHVQV
jgi:hypothetical protein